MFIEEECKICGHTADQHSGDTCHWRQHGALLACYCNYFVSPTAEAIASLPYDEQMILACANYFGIDPKYISRDGTTPSSRFIRFKISIGFSTSEQKIEWIKNNLPKKWIDWVEKYLTERV